jgi:sugar fermentation stimulation protein A
LRAATKLIKRQDEHACRGAANRKRREFAEPYLASGYYSLIIDLKRKKTIRVGRLGEAIFPAGNYVYTGSAMKGLGTRLRRHCSLKKKMHWHIDYLLALPEARIRKIILYPPAPGQECRQNQRIAVRPGATVIIKAFGASDCQSGCGSHLFFFAKDFLPKYFDHEAHEAHEERTLFKV